MRENIYFYYTNDLHSKFTHWPQVIDHFKSERAKRDAKNESHWLVDIGDHIDRVHPIAEAFMGRANVELMNDAGYDIVTLGNNEGITLAEEDLYHLYDQANFHVVCSNLQNMTDENPDWLESTVNIQSIGGVKIGVIGLTAPFNAFYHLLNWHVHYPSVILDKQIEQLKDSVDVIVLLSHLGFNEDTYIANKYHDIDVIIGGHTHHLLRTGEKVENTILTAAGKHCAYVGEVILTWDHEEKRLVNKQAYTTNITHLREDQETVQTLANLNKQANSILSEPIVEIDRPLTVNWFKKTEIIEQLTNTLMEWTKADCAMLNAGLLLERFNVGTITYKDVHRICPHPINPCVVELDGNELLEVVRVSLTKDLINLKLDGFGFRGKVIGKIIFAGLKIEVEQNKNDEQFVRKVYHNGYSLDPHKIYKVATADTFTFGRLFPEIAKSSVKKYYLPEFMRDLLTYTLKNNFSQSIS